MNPREHLLDWLRDAHGMELKAVEILEKQAARLSSYPALQARISEHTAESRRQAEQVAACIERLGGDPSVLKDTVGKLMGTAAAFTSAMADDEVVKNVLADYAFEHFEIACYRSLIAAAEAAGDAETVRVCQDILQEEEAMASWISGQIPAVTQQFLKRENPL